MTVELALVRQMWQLMEPVHATLYYAPEVFAEAESLGYNTETRWPTYFAWRSAPLGAAGPELVAATFYSFNPSMVRSHVPAAWEVATPSGVLSARSQAVDKALRSILKDDVDSPELTEAATLARELAESASTVARPLGAANAELPWPTEPHLVLWQAITTLRELRGDGHVAALLTAGRTAVPGHGSGPRWPAGATGHADHAGGGANGHAAQPEHARHQPHMIVEP